MREIVLLNDDWLSSVNSAGETQTTLPCIKLRPEFDIITFRTEITAPPENNGRFLYLELRGISGKTHVYCNDVFMTTFSGAFATFRVKLSESCVAGEKFNIKLMTEPYTRADGNFVFSGAKLIYTEKSHFEMDTDGSDGIFIKTSFKDGKVDIDINADIVNPTNYDVVSFTLLDSAMMTAASKTTKPTSASTTLTLEHADLWGGPQDAAIYTLKAQLLRDSTLLDELEIPFGIRNFEIRKDGFFCINGIRIPMSGIAFADCRAIKTDRRLFAALDANAVMISSMPTKSDLIGMTDKSGSLFWYNAPFTGDGDIDDLKAFLRRNYNHPSLAFICCPEQADEKYQKLFIKTVRESSNGLFPVIMTDVDTAKEKLSLGADVCAIRVPANMNAGALTELVGRFTELKENANGTVFAIVADPSVDVSKNEALDNFTEWNENLWKHFNREKGVISFFAGYIADGGANGEKTGLYDKERKNARDAFWFYRAQYSIRGFVKICQSTKTELTEKHTDIKCYTNSFPVRIVVNGKIKKKYKPESDGCGIYVFRKIKLRKNKNKIEISAGDHFDEIEIFVKK